MPTDGLAIASAVCGVSAFIPIVSQMVGLGLGVGSLVRMRRARLRGRPMRGAGWAWTGIVSSGFVLIGWIAAAGLLLGVASSLSESTAAFDAFTAMPR
ncbi:MAG: hypothetical protein ACE5E6_11890 [Phycisphaerae bacterium]